MERPLLLVILALCAGILSAQAPPIHHWPLDETSGTTAHAWGGPNGVLAGGTLWDPAGGHHQGAARFDGVDDRIVLGACEITTGSGFSLSFWTKADFVTGMERTLVAKTIGPQLSDHVWSVAFVNATALRFRLQAGGVTTELSTPPSSLVGGNWYHIVASYDGTEMRLILNGALMASCPKAGAIGLHPQAPASLGALSTGMLAYSGWIDDVRIYDRALTDNEVLDLLFGAMTTAIGPSMGILDPGQLRAGNHVLVRDMLGRLESEIVVASHGIEFPALSTGMHILSWEEQGGSHSVRLFVP